jgi:hypothetical protein
VSHGWSVRIGRRCAEDGGFANIRKGRAKKAVKRLGDLAVLATTNIVARTVATIPVVQMVKAERSTVRGSRARNAVMMAAAETTELSIVVAAATRTGTTALGTRSASVAATERMLTDMAAPARWRQRSTH